MRALSASLPEEPSADAGAPTDPTESPNPLVTSPRHRRSPATLLTWLTVVVVLVVVVVLLAVKAGTGNLGIAPPAPPPFTPASQQVVSDVTTIPASTYNAVGLASPAEVITPPAAAGDHAPLSSDGKAVVFFYGAEFCGYCAGERWALIAALSRFGTFTNLGYMRSTGTQSPAGIESFTFRDVSFKSRYVRFEAVERRSNYNPTGTSFTSLEVPDAQQAHLLAAFHVTGYPFIDFGNRYVTEGPSYSPTFLSGLTAGQIGSSLSTLAGDPHQPVAQQPVAQSIVALANYYTAAICASTRGQPGSVCESRAVVDAARSLSASAAA